MNQLAEVMIDLVLQWVTFRLNKETHGVNVMPVKEVLRYTPIAPVPGAKPYFFGISNFRGSVSSALSIRERFGFVPTEITDETRIIILEWNNALIGFVANSVSEVVYLKISEIEKTPNVGNDEIDRYIRGVCHKNNVFLILLELCDAFFHVDESMDEPHPTNNSVLLSLTA